MYHLSPSYSPYQRAGVLAFEEFRQLEMAPVKELENAIDMSEKIGKRYLQYLNAPA